MEVVHRLRELVWRDGDSNRDPVPWVAVLFLLNFCLQRISIPGISIPVTVPIALVWMMAGLALGVLSINRARLLIWLFAASISGLLVIAQLFVITQVYVSFNSWIFWVVIWLPIVVEFVDRTRDAYLRTARVIGHIGVGLASLSLVFMGVQLLGVRYYDWLGSLVPPNLLVNDYVITYPIVYGSPYYKSNGWIALEPSFMSFMIGVALVCALMTRASVVKVLFLVLGLLSTIAGSGIAIVAGYVVFLGFQRQLGQLRKYLLPSLIVGVVFGSTVFGQAIFGRVTEAGSSNSSTSLRAIEPYTQLWPYWIRETAGVFIGYGPGSSAAVVRGLGIDGLLVPSVAKVLFDYGLLGGAALIGVMVATYVGGPSRAFALTLAASMFTLQAASQPLVICSILFVAMWASPQYAHVAARQAFTGSVRSPAESGLPSRAKVT